MSVQSEAKAIPTVTNKHECCHFKHALRSDHIQMKLFVERGELVWLFCFVHSMQCFYLHMWKLHKLCASHNCVTCCRIYRMYFIWKLSVCVNLYRCLQNRANRVWIYRQINIFVYKDIFLRPRAKLWFYSYTVNFFQLTSVDTRIWDNPELHELPVYYIHLPAALKIIHYQNNICSVMGLQWCI